MVLDGGGGGLETRRNGSGSLFIGPSQKEASLSPNKIPGLPGENGTLIGTYDAACLIPTLCTMGFTI